MTPPGASPDDLDAWLDRLVDLPDDRRRELLDRECDAPELRRRLERILAADGLGPPEG